MRETVAVLESLRAEATALSQKIFALTSPTDLPAGVTNEGAEIIGEAGREVYRAADDLRRAIEAVKEEALQAAYPALAKQEAA